MPRVGRISPRFEFLKAMGVVQVPLRAELSPCHFGTPLVPSCQFGKKLLIAASGVGPFPLTTQTICLDQNTSASPG